METMNKPNLFIVGAAKAGTTALHAILSKHPEVFMSPVKEPNFFSKDIEVTNFSTTMQEKLKHQKIQKNESGKIIPRHQLYIQSLETYLDLFGNATEEHKIKGEASVSYLFSEVAAEEIFKFNPKAKIIILVREPVGRAFSHYLMDRKVGNNKTESFIQAIQEDYRKDKHQKKWGNAHLYVELGLYYQQIKRYVNIFDKDNILIIKYADFNKNNQLILNEITRFLNIQKYELLEGKTTKNKAMLPKNGFGQWLLHAKFLKRWVGFASPQVKENIKKIILSDKKTPILDEDIRKRLGPYFEEDIKKLNNELGVYF